MENSNTYHSKNIQESFLLGATVNMLFVKYVMNEYY